MSLTASKHAAVAWKVKTSDALPSRRTNKPPPYPAEVELRPSEGNLLSYWTARIGPPFADLEMQLQVSRRGQ